MRHRLCNSRPRRSMRILFDHGTPAPLIPFLLEGVFEHGLFQQDGIHPNAQGYAMVAQTVLRYLKPLITQGGGKHPGRPPARGV